MILLPRVTPAEFRAKWAAFKRAAEFLELDPHDRNLAWREMTGDDQWHEWPVPASHFVDDPFYVGEKIFVRPWLRDDIFGDLGDPDYEPQALLLIAGLGSGKGLALDTPLPTPTGWTTMGEVRPGDRLLDEQGRPTSVGWVSEDRHLDCYRVSFSDGTSVVCDGDHLWTTLEHRTRKNVRRRPDAPSDWRDAWGHATTAACRDIAGTVMSGGQRNHVVPAARALDLPAASLPVDPYVLGAWLGDGTTIYPNICTPDAEVLDRIRAAGWSATVIPSTDDGRTAPTYHLAPPASSPAATGTAALREIGVLGRKHIPAAYLRASRRQRLRLLYGLMDTDGFAGDRGGACGIDLCDERLARDTMELIRSLGWIAHVNVGRARLNGKDCGRRWRMSFTPEESPFTLERKSAAVRSKREPLRTTGRTITSIEPVASVTTRCLAVDSPRSLFLCGEGMIPTHNSFAAALMLLYKLYELSCMKNPQEYLSAFPGVSLSGDAPLAVSIVSAAGARQAIKVIYDYVFKAVEDSPYFHQHFPPWKMTGERIAFDHRIEVAPGTSDARSVLGFNVYAFVLDEAAFGSVNDHRDSAKELFLAMHNRRRSRFGRYGLGGMFTSPGTESSFVELFASDGGELGEVMVRRTTTWEAKGELTPGSKVFLLNTDPLATRVMETELIYLEPGLARRQDGSLVRFGVGLGGTEART